MNGQSVAVKQEAGRMEKVIDFGWAVGRLTPSGLTIIAPSDANDSGMMPAQCVYVGARYLPSLRDLLVEEYPPHPVPPQKEKEA